jgi:hypothetical protein
MVRGTRGTLLLALLAGMIGATTAAPDVAHAAPAPPAPPAAAASREVPLTLQGSRGSMLRQNRIAREHEFTFLRTPAQVRGYVDAGNLVPVPGNDDYGVIASHPYARPETRLFVERLAAGYRAACGERMVVTSLTRPTTRQPRNASPLSVHPAGMAVDLRYPANPECRQWLKDELLALEALEVLDATLEFRPPHFHVAIFPAPFVAHVERLLADSTALADAARRDSVLMAEAVQGLLAAEAEAAAQAQAPALVRFFGRIARFLIPARATA